MDRAVDAAVVAGTKPVVDLTFLGLFLNADLIGKTVIVLLIVASFWSWAIIIEKLLRLRRGVMLAGTDNARQQELLRASLSTLLVIFRGVMRLQGDVPPRDSAQVIATVSARCGFPAAPFEQVLAYKRGSAMPSGDTERVLEGYVAGMTALVAYLNRFQLPGQGDMAGLPPQ